MDSEFIGKLSGILVAVSIVPYAYRTFQGVIRPNVTSWALWSVLGLAILLTYKSSGAQSNVWPAVFGFTNPTLVTALALRTRGTWGRPLPMEVACIVTALASLAMWMVVREDQELSSYALYLAIVADACAAIPTFVGVWMSPEEDRPFAWFAFAFGYGLAFFAVTEVTFANYALPTYMVCGSIGIGLPLALCRWKRKAPWHEWI